jgi:[ribosomal protein S18]-alanine N-acetyltransferase
MPSWRMKTQAEPHAIMAVLRITEGLASDIPAVAAIEAHSNLEPWTRESFLEELLRPHSFLQVARVREGFGESVAGFICFWLVADEIQVLNVAVHEAHRRRGIGRALMLDCLHLGIARKARKAVLEVRASNLAAQRLYANLGFLAVGQRPDYYEGLREPALLMELNVADAPIAVGHNTRA